MVIATRDRPELLNRLLDALATQIDAPSFEVVVVDDGSRDPVEPALAHREPLPYPLRVLRQEESTGPAGARNLGWRATTAGLVAFTDDDCVPTSRWLAALADSLTQVDIAAGPTTFPDDQAEKRGTWSYWLVDDGTSGHFSTCNVAYRREVLDTVDGFDAEAFATRRRHGSARCINGEDTDLAWRAIEHGFASGFAADAVVHHEVFPSDWRRYLRNTPRLEGLVLLLRKHPQLRARFGKEWFWDTHHAAAIGFWLGIGALAFRRTRPFGVVLSAASADWYTRLFRHYRMAPQEAGGYWTALPLGLVADSYATLIMLRASVRYRTLML